jgi:A/G-specific adenine glycosylase
VGSLRSALLAWYGRAARDLPWRRTRDPYAVWVSEVMLQQTRVETVVRYYDRFLARFPTPQALAAAGEDDVMALWSGLGYYRRARLLHSGVREVVARYGGSVPRDPDHRRALPGVGRYTAGAIGSIAFDRAEPIVDGNVARVLSRLFALEAPLGSAASERALWRRAGELVEGQQPGALNQALMELGAVVCVKGKPRCADCPVAGHCQARAQGRTGELPKPRARHPRRALDVVALVATRGRGAQQAIVLARGRGSLFSGLWNLPMSEGRGIGAARRLLADSNLSGTLAPSAAGEIEHVLSHRALRVQLFRVIRARLRPGSIAHAVLLTELAALGISRLTHKALAAVLGSQAVQQ